MGKKIELSVDPSYVANWGIWEGIRELLQNALDRKDQGADMTVKYDKRSKRLRIITTGEPLERKALLLGHSTKREDSSQRGRHGDGLKSAMLVLPRFDLEVWIKSGSERWAPIIGHSTTFGSDVLKIDVASVKHFDGVEVQVRGLSPEDWKLVQSRVLFFDKKFDKVNGTPVYCYHGRILPGKKYQGKLFVGGIYVQELPDRYETGFDLPPERVTLGRDRGLVDQSTVRYHIRGIIKEGVVKGELGVDDVYDALEKEGGGEAVAFKEEWSSRDGFHDKIAERFKSLHGDHAVPVSTTEEADAVGRLGMKGIQVSPGLKKVVEMHEGDLATRRQKAEMRPTNTIPYSDLTMQETLLLRIAVNLVNNVEELCSLNTVQVVEFHDSTLSATIEGGLIRLNREILNDFAELVYTLVSQVASLDGASGEESHQERAETLFGEIIENMARVVYPHAFPDAELQGDNDD